MEPYSDSFAGKTLCQQQLNPSSIQYNRDWFIYFQLAHQVVLDVIQYDRVFFQRLVV